ncbi:MAG TPA: MFS transporter [Ktedonobacteraceae bacterium]|nr:MFS transporter [Ktedonobacteraceae bacterium]
MRVPRLLVDLSPLRESVPYRTLFWGQLISLLGTQLTVVALPFQIYVLTRSSLAVGLIGLVQLGPTLLFTLYGGTLADAIDRRRVLFIMQLLLLLTTIALAIATLLSHPPIWLLYLLAALLAGIAGVDGPARGAATRNLVRRELFPAAAALNALLRQSGAVVGPAIAGLIISRFNLSVAYWLDAATYGAALLSVALLPPQPPKGGGRVAGWTSFREGIHYLRGRPVVQGVLLTDINAMVFGMPRALFPAFGLTVLQGGAQAVGLLYAAPAAGALIGAASSGWVGRISRPGRAVLVMVGLWGVAITIFGFSTWLPIALLMLAFAGWADIISEVLRSSMLQLSIPDDLRGRITAVWLAQANSSPRLGDVESGLVAAITNAQVSAATGGIACVAGVLVLTWLLPTFRQFRMDKADEPETSL